MTESNDPRALSGNLSPATKFTPSNDNGSPREAEQEAAGEPSKPRLREILGPGLVTGASDDDPSGIATYSQAGAQFVLGLE